jgi:hypothetical protein
LAGKKIVIAAAADVYLNIHLQCRKKKKREKKTLNDKTAAIAA